MGNGDGTFGEFRYVLNAFGSNGRPSPMSLHVADANVDGRTDIYAFSHGRVDIAPASGGGNYAAPYLASTEFTADRFDFNHFKLADIGGDARPDVLFIRHVPGIAPMSAIARRDGTCGTSQTSTNNSDQSGNAIFRTAGVTGDGYADAVRFGNDVNTYTGRAVGAGTFTTFGVGVGVGHFGYNNGAGYGTATQPSPSIGNVSNDHRANLVGFSSSGVVSATSRGDGTFDAARRVNAGFGSGRGWTVAQHPRLLADVTGEGWADVVGFGNAGVFVALANGSGGFTGGPEAVTVPLMRGLSYDQTQERLAAEGLRVGSIRGVEDRSCDFLDEVMSSSSPSAGTDVAVGTAVSLTIGEQPSTPCQ